jgi:hypothetical protein
MGDSVEARTQEPSFSAARPHCLKCGGNVLLAAMISDVRRALIVRVFECECGELLWDEKPSRSPPERAATPATDDAFADGAFNGPNGL